jgi:hypothetical protein
MSDSESKSQIAAFGVPDRHFLRLAFDLLNGLESQSRERGHSALASLIEIAKTEAEDALRADAETLSNAASENKLLRLVKAIRTKAASAR